jgi:hypothetical protein
MGMALIFIITANSTIAGVITPLLSTSLTYFLFAILN